MWRHVEGDKNNMGWLSLALNLGSAIMVTDGSYNNCLAPHISGAGWTIACRQKQKMVGGWFYEHSKKAGSYQDELLGSVAIHLLAAFTKECFAASGCTGEILCDNLGALKQASKMVQCVKMGSKHSDLLRSLRSIKTKCPMTFCYTHVRGHQDKHIPWRALTLIEQMNVACNSLAGQAVFQGVANQTLSPGYHLLLPREGAAIVLPHTFVSRYCWFN